MSIFLAKAFGLYAVIAGISLLLRGKKIREIMSDLDRNPALVFITGAFTLIVGILLVLSHNIWVSDWRILITIFSWAALIKGSLLMAQPECAMTMGKKMLSKTVVYIAGIFYILLGICLCYHGFFAV